MKKTILVLLTSGLFAIAANAQDIPAPPKPGTPPPMMSKEDRAKRKAEREAAITKNLSDIGATDDQVKQVKDAMEDARKKHEDLKKDATLSDDDKKAKGKELMEAQQAKMKEILGEEKFKKFRESQKAMMKNMPGMMPPPPAPKN